MINPSDYFTILGFSDKEALVYTTLQKLGPTPASTLARLTNIKRTSIYDVLNVLLERNLIISVRQNHTTCYSIDDINKLLLYEKERLHVAGQLVEQLKARQQFHQGMQVHFYRGQEGFREMYEDILRAKTKEILVWVNLDTFYSGLDLEREEAWTRERVAQKTYARLFMLDSPSARKFKKQDSENYRTTVLLPDSTWFSTTCFLYDNYTTYFDSAADMSGVRIHSPELFQMQKNIFDMQWTMLNS